MTCSFSTLWTGLTMAACLNLGSLPLSADGPTTKAITGQAIALASYDQRLAFTVSGRVKEVLVKAGQTVTAGQTLIELEDDEGAALVAVYEIRAKSELEIQQAQAKLELAQLEEKRLGELIQKNAAAPFEYQKAIINRRLAEVEREQASQQKAESVQVLAQAMARHKQYQLVAAIDGVIDQVIVHEGETVETLKPVLRLVQPRELWIDVPIATGDSLGLTVGDPATIDWTLTNPAIQTTGRILHITQADAASETRTVRVQADNPGVPTGTHVNVQFSPPIRPTPPLPPLSPSKPLVPTNPGLPATE